MDAVPATVWNVSAVSFADGVEYKEVWPVTQFDLWEGAHSASFADSQYDLNKSVAAIRAAPGAGWEYYYNGSPVKNPYSKKEDPFFWYKSQLDLLTMADKFYGAFCIVECSAFCDFLMWGPFHISL